MITKIISGAQTGADKAGLDAAVALGMDRGGWIPKGRRTDEEPLSQILFSLYRLQEHPSPYYPPRTEQNVLDSDGTVLFGDMNSPGCKLTIKLCQKHNKPYYAGCSDAARLRGWCEQHHIRTLNVAGTRERTYAAKHGTSIHKFVYDLLLEAFSTKD